MEQGVEEQHLRVKVPLNQDVHITPEVLCAGSGVMDVDRLNFNAMTLKSVDVNGHQNHPVGISVKLPDNGLVGTTHRETYISDHQTSTGKPARMQHAIAGNGMTFHPPTLKLNHEKSDISVADARSERWPGVTADHVGEHMNYAGVHSMEHESGDIAHLVPVSVTEEVSNAPLPHFFAANKTNSKFLRGAYVGSKPKIVQHNGVDKMVVSDEDMKSAAGALKEHLTPQSPLSKGFHVHATALDDHPVACGAHAMVAMTLTRTPTEVKEASGQALTTFRAPDGSAESAKLHSDVFGKGK